MRGSASSGEGRKVERYSASASGRPAARRSGARRRRADPSPRPGGRSSPTSRATRSPAPSSPTGSPGGRLSPLKGEPHSRRLHHGEHVVDVLREAGDGLVGHSASSVTQRPAGDRVGARGSAEAEVDPVWVRRFQQGELLGHHERGVIRQHHPARPDPDVSRGGGDHGDQHRRVRGCHGGHVVVLGHPVAAEAERVGRPRQREGAAKRRRWSRRCAQAPGRARTAQAGRKSSRFNVRSCLTIPRVGGRISPGRPSPSCPWRGWRRR